MKSKTKPLPFIPQSRNFSDFYSTPLEENNEDTTLGYDASDKGKQADEALSMLQADQLLVSILLSLDDRDKIIFLYQVLREAGYNLQHEECARTLNLSRGGYIVLIKKVKEKCVKILQASAI